MNAAARHIYTPVALTPTTAFETIDAIFLVHGRTSLNCTGNSCFSFGRDGSSRIWYYSERAKYRLLLRRSQNQSQIQRRHGGRARTYASHDHRSVRNRKCTNHNRNAFVRAVFRD